MATRKYGEIFAQGWTGGSVLEDIRAWAFEADCIAGAAYLSHRLDPEPIARAISSLGELATWQPDDEAAMRAAIRAAWRAFGGARTPHSDRDRLALYGVEYMDRLLTRVAARAAIRYASDWGCRHALCIGIGLIAQNSVIPRKVGTQIEHASVLGLDVLRDVGKQLEGDSQAPSRPTLDDLRRDGRVDDVRLDVVDRIPTAPGLAVVPVLPFDSSTRGRERRAAVGAVAGKRLPLATWPDVAQVSREMREAWPHATEVIDAILRDGATGRDAVRIRPTLLVGPPGSGKSTLAQQLAGALGLPSTIYSCAGMADGSAGGTSAQWTTARPSVPLQLVVSSEWANVMVIWDEVDKASDERRNGALADVLLPLLEPSTAGRMRDLCLEVDVDLSHVSHVLTANALDGVPDPLRDRCRILRMPAARPEHLTALLPAVLQGIAVDRALDDEWLAPLAQDELDLIASTWGGGSLRRLRRVVETVLDTRDVLAARH